MMDSLRGLPHKIARRIFIDPTTLCWEWCGRRSRNGYGRIYWHGKERAVHRVVFLLRCDSIPEGMVLDHLCRNRACCNPAHTDPATHQENTMWGDATLFKPTKENSL